MLAVTRTRAHLQGFGATAPLSGMFPVLGVPFKWKGVLLLGNQPYYMLDGDSVVDVPKSRVPAPLAQAIDQHLSPFVAKLVRDNPELAANPRELIAQAKAKAHLTGPADAYKSSISDFVYMANLARINSVNNVHTTRKFIVLAQDIGSSIRVKLHMIPPDSGVPGFDALTDIMVKVSSVPVKVWDVTKGGLEAAMQLIGDIMKGLCVAAQSDAVKLAQTIASSDVNISANLKASGANAQMTAAADTAAKAAAAAKADPRVAAAQAGLKVLQGFCSGGPSASPPPPGTEEKKSLLGPIALGVGVLAVGTISVLAVRKVRR